MADKYFHPLIHFNCTFTCFKSTYWCTYVHHGDALSINLNHDCLMQCAPNWNVAVVTANQTRTSWQHTAIKSHQHTQLVD